MTNLEVFDPPMCCSSGVCGPQVDPALMQFAADLEWFKRQGVTVARYNLAQQPLAFVQNDTVREALQEDDESLPLVLVDGQVVSWGKYPIAEELAVSLCVSMVARNESPKEKAPALAALAEGRVGEAALSNQMRRICCGPRAGSGKGERCCS